MAHVVVDRGPERSAQRNHGAALATGEVVLFIDSDMVLEPTVLADIAETFGTRPGIGAVIIPERSFGVGFLASCRVLEKSLYVGQDDVEAPRAFRREVFELVGRWDETLTAAEDWDLADRTRAAGVGIARITSWIWHDEGTISLRAQFTKKQYYGRWVAEYLEPGAPGPSPPEPDRDRRAGAHAAALAGADRRDGGPQGAWRPPASSSACDGPTARASSAPSRSRTAA